MRHSILLLILVLASCATNVKTIKKDIDKTLDSDTGYLLIGVETNRDLKSISLFGPKHINLSSNDLRQGSNFILVDLPAGTYVINNISLNNIWKLEMIEEDYWEIELLPGKVNYVGHINISSTGWWRPRSKIELVNKSSYAVEFMQQNFPTILANKQLYYGGPAKDAFFEFLNKNSKKQLEAL